jgi:hypothetical protein
MEEEKGLIPGEEGNGETSTCESDKSKNGLYKVAESLKKIYRQALITEYYKVKKRVRSMLVMSALEVPN